MDGILDNATISEKHAAEAHRLKERFGLEDLEDDDFASVLAEPLGYWQARNWDPKVGSNKFYEFCDVLQGDLEHDVDKESRAVRKRLLENYSDFIKV